MNLQTFKPTQPSASQSRPLSIAICGTRGVPACYGGFETFAEELGTRLAARGHDVVVYGRSHVISHTGETYRGVRVRLLPAPRHKYLETPVHTFRSFVDLVKRPVDVVLVCNAANSPFIWLPRLFRMPVAVNVDGVERLRAKWNALGRLWYRLGEITSVLFASRVIADADVIRDYYARTYRAQSEVIRYGYRKGDESEIERRLSGQSLELTPERQALFDELGVKPGRYLLYVSRLEPENNAHVVIRAYESLTSAEREHPLVVVGDAPYAAEYISSLRSLAGPSVRFAGYRFGSAYTTLQLGCYAYIQATEVGGTHPALVEALGYGSAIIANDVPEHREVIGDAGLLYAKNDPDSLAARMSEVLASPDLAAELRRRARALAIERFDWELICDQYERMLRALVGDRARVGDRSERPGKQLSAGDFE